MLFRTAFLIFFLLSTALIAQETQPAPSLHVGAREGLIKHAFIEDTLNHRADADAKTRAELFLFHYAQGMGLPEDLSNLKLNLIQESLLGQHLHFQQTKEGYPVSGAEVIVSLNKNDRVYMVYNNTWPDQQSNKLASVVRLERAQAFDRAWTDLRVHGDLMAEPKASLEWHAQANGALRLVYRVHLGVQAPFGHWVHLIDADSGEVVSVRRDEISNHPLEAHPAYEGPIWDRGKAFSRWFEKKNEARSLQKNARTADGSGQVFETDPRTALQDGSLTDNSPASAFTSAYVTKTLPDISDNGGTWELIGPHVRIVNFEAPNTRPSTTGNGQWTAARGNNAFNDAMAYFQIDQSQRYIQSLGFNSIQNTSIQVDTDGVNGEDNSYFIPNTNQIAFGHGCVDDSEESFTILHEYGHAIHTAIAPNWYGGDTGAIGEGFGDYWAASHRYATPNGQSWNPNWAFPWVGHNSCWQGRNMDNTAAQYNHSRNYGAHEFVDGFNADELWASPLFQAHRDLVARGVPRTEIDRIVLQAMYGTGANIKMRELASNIVNVAGQLYPDGPHASVFTQRFQAQNILTGGDGGGNGGGDGGSGGGDGDLSNGQSMTVSGSRNSETRYTVVVPSGASNLVIRTAGGSGDVDLYVRRGEQATLNNWDHRPYEYGNDETVTIGNPTADTWHIMLHGWEAYSNTTLSVSWQGGDGGGNGGGDGGSGGGDGGSGTGGLVNGQGVSVSGGVDSETRYSLTIPQGATNLLIRTSGGTGDVDLYVSQGSEPGLNQYDFRPYEYGNDETVSVAAPATGTWHVMLHGYEAYSGVTLIASWDTNGGGDGGGGNGGGDGGSGGDQTSTFAGTVASGAAEFFDIQVTGGVITITLNWTGNADLDLYLYDENGVEVAHSWWDQPETISFNTNGQGGTYTIEVYNYEGGSTNFTVEATHP